MFKCHKYLLLSSCFSMSFIHSLLSSMIVWKSPERLWRNAIHIPWGFSGLFISEFNIHYGYIYFIMICLYQIMEQIEHLYLESSDRSWYDMEGYILGFSYGVFYLFIYNLKKQKYETLIVSE